MKTKPQHMKSRKAPGLGSAKATILACVLCTFAVTFGAFFLAQHGGTPQPETSQDLAGLIDQESNPNADPADITADDDPGPSDEEIAAKKAELDASLGYEHDAILFTVEEGQNAEQVNEMLASFGFITTGDVSDQDLSLGFVRVEIDEQTSVEEAVQTIAAAGIESQPNFIYQLADDEILEAQAESYQWALNSVGAINAWSTLGYTAETKNPVTVAIIDTGCLTTHEDLTNNIKYKYNATNPHSTNYSDDNGHGTHVAGIVGAQVNDTGVSGVAHNPDIAIVKANTGGKNFTSATLTSAFTWVYQNASRYNIRVANCSVGGVVTNADSKLMSAIANARSKNVLVACAAGNQDGTFSVPGKFYPSDYAEGVIGVINIDSSNKRASGSNYNTSSETEGNSNKNLSAPGTSIISTTYSSNSSYGYMSGTSMASPYVAGVASLVYAYDYQQDNDFDFTEEDVRKILYATAADINKPGWDAETGYGEVSASNALRLISASLTGADSIAYKSSVTITPTYGAASDWTWSSSDPNVATVDANGTVTACGTGTATITATYKKATVIAISKTVTVSKLDISSMTVSNIEDSYYYSGSAIEPLPTVSLGEIPLVKDVDYTLSYANNAQIGSASVTVTPTGNCTGAAKTQNFELLAFDLGNVEVSPISDRAYTGEAITPKPSVTADGRTLVENADYTLSYENNIEPGTASVIISAAENSIFTGERTVTFRIATSISGVSIDGIASNVTYTGKAFEPDPVLAVNGYQLVKDTDYAVSYKNNINAGTATVIVTGLSNDKGGFTGTVEKTFTINQADLTPATLAGINGSYTYTGSAITPSPTATLILDGSPAALTMNTDYSIVYGNNTNVGTASVAIVGKGNFKGSINKTFSITRASVSGAAIGSVSNQIYTGSAIRPAPSVTVNGRTLVAGTDFDYSYSNNINVGTATITITGKGNYTGTNSTRRFAIAQRNIQSGNIAPVSAQSYTGNEIRPKPKVTCNGRTLTEGVDYTLSYSNNVNVGTAAITATDRGNYTGSVSSRFTIGTTLRTSCRTHVENDGWQSWRTASQGASLTSGTSGRGLRLEGVQIKLYAGNVDISNSIQYRTHVQDIGWQSWRSGGATAGTSGQALRLEAIQIKLDDFYASKYDIYYRVHAQNVGWMSWAKNGEVAGTAGYAYRLEALQICIVAKGAAAPAESPSALTVSHFQSLKYRTHVENDGWQNYVTEASMSGTTGRALRLEGINITLGEPEYSGSIQYRTHVQNIGWQSWRYNGDMAGTSGQALRLEAIEIKLNGQMAQYYDIYYRTHVQNIGWTGWAANGNPCGSSGYAYRLEGIEIRLVPKGKTIAGSSNQAYYSR